MSSFNNLLSRAYLLSEAKISPYSSAHPSFGAITSKMRAGGLSSAPLDTIKFIREVLYNLDIISDEELSLIKRSAGFTGKKQAMLTVLKTKQQEINAKAEEIADRVSSTLDDFINGVGTNRGREEKYAAQAAAQEIASQMRQTKSGKEMDDALSDIVSDESLLVRTAVAKILADIQKNLGEPGFDIDEEALSEVIDYSNNLNSLATLRTFIQQISAEPGYEKIAAYLSSAVKPISQGAEDEEMQEEEEYDDSKGKLPVGYDKEESVELRKAFGLHNNPKIALSDASVEQLQASKDWYTAYIAKWKENNEGEIQGPAQDYITQLQSIERELANRGEEEEAATVDDAAAITVGESYTSNYLTEQIKKDSFFNPQKAQSQSFRDRFKPTTSHQLEELRRYGL
jgi:hypothetical protein